MKSGSQESGAGSQDKLQPKPGLRTSLVAKLFS